MQTIQPALTRNPDIDRFIGKTGQDVEVLAFRGGGFDTAMYLGVIQAWLLMNKGAPTLVTGVSAGAIAAVAMAEVYEAGARTRTGRRWLADCVNWFLPVRARHASCFKHGCQMPTQSMLIVR